MFIKGFTLKVHPEGNLIKFGLLLCLLSLVLLTISGRGCPKRSRDKIRSSGYEWAGIAAPSSLTATAFSSSEIRLSWSDNSNNEDGFAIERKEWTSVNWVEIGRVGPNITSYSDTEGLSPSILYYDYRVRAFNTIGDYSNYSNEARADISQTILWSKIFAGYSHTLACTTDGRLWVWGSNEGGQLGLSDVNDRIVPTLIVTDWRGEIFEDIDSSSGGLYHTIARKTNGTLWAWGGNGAGQLGFGDIFSVDAPDQTGNDADWSAFATGLSHSFGIKTNNTLWAWGYNISAQLGLGGTWIEDEYRWAGDDIYIRLLLLALLQIGLK